MVWSEELKRSIPEGWHVTSIFDTCDVKYGYPLFTEIFAATGTPVIRIRDILDNSISAYTSQRVAEAYKTKTGDLLIGMDGNFQMNFWHNEGDIVNQRIVRVRKKKIPLLIIKYQIEPIISAKVFSVARSTVGHLSDKDIKSLKIIDTHGLNLEVFNSILQEICKIKQENIMLTSFRDFLLPMLMNGQALVGD